MSNISVNTITDALGGSTASINGLRPQASNMQPYNAIINGNFDIWQRGTSFSNPDNTYTADRFLVVAGGGATGDTVSRQSFTAGQTDVPNEPSYFLRFSVGGTSANRVMHHRVEDVRTFAGQTCTLTFWAKASVAHSSTLEIQQNFGSGGSASVTLSPVSYSMTTSWQKFTFTQTMPSIAGKTIGSSSYVYLAFIRSLGASSVNIDIAQMQLEAGSSGSSFAHENVGDTLQKCQRYYTATKAFGFVHSCNSTVSAFAHVQFPVTMRSTPALSMTYTYGNFYIAGSARTITAFTPQNIDPKGFQHHLQGSGFVSGNAGHLDANPNFYAADAEL